jgi:hypothetical protein
MREIEVLEIQSRKDWKAFLRLPWHIYQEDPHWVPPLLVEQKKMLNPKVNPFFQAGKASSWITREQGRVTGRILAFIDPHHNQFHQDKVGFVGFFECIDDQDTANRLFQQAAAWLKQAGAEVVRGPVNLSMSNESGVLTSGFDHAPFVQMNHTPPYYQKLFENGGFRASHLLRAYIITVDEILNNKPLLPRLRRIADRVAQQNQFTIRPINMKRYREEVLNITRLYNEFMKGNWGFVPASEEEMFFMGESLKLVIDPEMVFFIEREGKPVGCSLSVPNINQLLPHLNGKLFPFGFLKFLYHRRRIKRMRLMLLGVEQGFRNKGLDILLYHHTIKQGMKQGYTAAELSWISDDNATLISIMDKLGASLYKTYQVYDKPLLSS